MGSDRGQRAARGRVWFEFALVLTATTASAGSTGSAGAAGSTGSTGSGSGAASGSSLQDRRDRRRNRNGGANKPYIDAFDSAVKAANAAGGIHGHPIDLVVCDSQANNNAAASCGQQMVSKHVIGVMADDSGEDTWIPYLQNANIPVFTGGGLPLEYTSPVSFITNDFSDLVSSGYVALLAQAGCKSVASVLALVGSTSTAIRNISPKPSRRPPSGSRWPGRATSRCRRVLPTWPLT